MCVHVEGVYRQVVGGKLQRLKHLAYGTIERGGEWGEGRSERRCEGMRGGIRGGVRGCVSGYERRCWRGSDVKGNEKGLASNLVIGCAIIVGYPPSVSSFSSR